MTTFSALSARALVKLLRDEEDKGRQTGRPLLHSRKKVSACPARLLAHPPIQPPSQTLIEFSGLYAERFSCTGRNRIYSGATASGFHGLPLVEHAIILLPKNRARIEQNRARVNEFFEESFIGLKGKQLRRANGEDYKSVTFAIYGNSR